MKRGFTLVELMVVIGIMAIMGSLTVAGYRQMKRGMEERSVIQNVNEFMNGAAQRAQIDRQNVAVYFWNEALKGETEDSHPVVVGKAVAVRRVGRISKVGGNYLWDEFGDLEFRSDKFLSKLNDSSDDGNSQFSGDSTDGSLVTLYKMKKNGGIEKCLVKESTVESSLGIRFVHGAKNNNNSGNGNDANQDESEDSVSLEWCYAFELKDSNDSWDVGDAYGFEFANITLPKGYIFGERFPRDMNEPITEIPHIYIEPKGDPSYDFEVRSLRLSNGGELSAELVGKIKPKLN